MTVLALDLLRCDGGTQPRDHLSMTVAQEYAEAMADGAAFPPVTAYFDGTTYYLADGFHRLEAHRLIGALVIEADVRQGALRDAVLFSVGANAAHGYRRTNADKRRAVLTLLGDPDWAAWSDREIARRCAVSAPFVAGLRPAPAVNVYSEPTRIYTDRHHQERVMRVASIGRTPTLVGDDAPPPPSNVETLPPPLAERPTRHDWSQGTALLYAADAITSICRFMPASAVLSRLRDDVGGFPDLDAVCAAGAWMAEFVAGFPEVEAARRQRASHLQEALRHVA